jgi:transcriptional regulator with XRE-family HTH domain
MIGQRLKKLRRDMKVRQEDLANILGVQKAVMF